MRIETMLAAAALLAGCATEEPAQNQTAAVAEIVSAAPQAVEPPPYVAQVNEIATAAQAAKIDRVSYKQVTLDGFAAQSVATTDVRRSRTNDGYERVQVLVKNVTAAPMRVRYRFDWQDANGVVIDDPDNSGWEKETLVPGDAGTLTSIAPKKDCKDFRLRLKLVQ